MANLDDVNAIKKLDVSNMLGSIEELHLQCEQTWGDIGKITVPDTYKRARNVVVAGMGGSALGPHVVQSLFFDQLMVPLHIINDYHLPAYVNEDSIVLLSSNSGTTEEVLSAAKESLSRRAMLMGMSAGGKLSQFFNDHNVPAYMFKQTHNPSGQPRMGNGYMIVGMIGLFYKAGLIQFNEKEISESVALMILLHTKWGVGVPTKNNPAKEFAIGCHGKIVALVGSSFLMGNVHAWNNQINENAKNFSLFQALPELNHHLLEGLGFPKTNPNTLAFLFINSPLYEERIRKRFALTMDVVAKNKIDAREFVPEGTTRLAQSLVTLLFGSYFGFYLAMLNDLNPSPIPWVDYFKAELAK